MLKALNKGHPKKSSWRPEYKPPSALSLFLEKNQVSLSPLMYQKCRDNLSREERKALRDLKSNKELIIKPADKGSSVVLLSKEDYLKEGNRQLNTPTYEKITNDPTPEHLNEIQSAVKVLPTDDEIKERLLPSKPSCPQLYLLPKIHKIGNPGRPIVSGCSCPTVQISRFLDTILRPLAAQIPSFIQDTTHFLNHIEEINKQGPLPDNVILVSADVSSLYTNIPHNDGIKACEKALNKRPSSSSSPTHHLLRLLELVLKLNAFQFNGDFYLQKEGTAMGTPTAPSYANLFMACIEEDLLSNAPTQPFRSSWRRFIDDVNFIWSEGKESLDTFIQHTNTFHTTIKFTFETSPAQVPFLDVLLYTKNNQLHTTLYTKPTDSHAYLLPQSCHPPHIFTSIPYSQTLRIRRICSDPDTTEENITKLKQYLTKRKYNAKTIETSTKKAQTTPRSQLLHYNKRKKNENRTPFVMTYHPNLKNMSKIIQENMHILHESQITKDIFPEPPLISFRRCRSLKDLLVSSRVNPQNANQPVNIPDKPQTETGSNKCNAKKCCVCPYMQNTKHFSSTSTGQKYYIPQHINCKSSWVIYLITCKKCQKQYIGKTTTTLYTRFNNTRSDIRKYNTNKRKEIPIAAHFNLSQHKMEDMTLTGIEQIRNRSDHNIRKRESYWIALLKTLHPHGINMEE